MFDYKEEYLAKDLLENIRRIMSGSFKVILANDLKKNRWLGDACFDMNDDDDAFGKQGFEEAINRIKNPKSFISKLTKSKVLYEIYDWNTYQSIEKQLQYLSLLIVTTRPFSLAKALQNSKKGQ